MGINDEAQITRGPQSHKDIHTLIRSRLTHSLGNPFGSRPPQTFTEFGSKNMWPKQKLENLKMP